MSTYTRKGVETESLNPAVIGMEPEAAAPAGDSIRVDGFAQVLAMLQIADAEFRESLLRRLAARDRNLAAQLREALADSL
jgi:hypothetical protein